MKKPLPEKMRREIAARYWSIKNTPTVEQLCAELKCSKKKVLAAAMAMMDQDPLLTDEQRKIAGRYFAIKNIGTTEGLCAEYRISKPTLIKYAMEFFPVKECQAAKERSAWK